MFNRLSGFKRKYLNRSSYTQFNMASVLKTIDDYCNKLSPSVKFAIEHTAIWGTAAILGTIPLVAPESDIGRHLMGDSNFKDYLRGYSLVYPQVFYIIPFIAYYVHEKGEKLYKKDRTIKAT